MLALQYVICITVCSIPFHLELRVTSEAKRRGKRLLRPRPAAMSLPRDVDHRHEGRTRDSNQGITRNIDHFMEELRREQEAHDRRTAEFEKRRNELRSQDNQTENGATILDGGEGGGEKDEEDWEEEYVVLDLDDVFRGAPIPNCAYSLSGLDTMNPILTLDNGLKLIGRYTETIGSVVIYSEKEEDEFEAQADTRDLPIPADPYAGNTAKKSLKRIRGVCMLERKLKFCAMPIEDAPGNNFMFMQSASAQNAMAAGDASLHKAVPTEDTSLENAWPMEDVSLENTMLSGDVPMENPRATGDASLENAVATEDALLDSARATEDTSVETATATGYASVENAATEDALLVNTTALEGASVENTRATEGAALKNATVLEHVSVDNINETQDAPLENTSATEGAALENATATKESPLENATLTEDASLVSDGGLI